MSVLVLLCGPAFAGKSTLAARLARAHGAAVVSLDELNARRGLASGSGLPDSEWARTLEEAVAEAATLLAAGRDRVVVDDTLCFRFLRDRFRGLARAHGARTALVVLEVPRQEVERRARANRLAPARANVAPAVLARHLGAFEWPGADEPHRVLREEGDLARWMAEGWL